MSSTTIQQQHTQAPLPQKSQATQSFHWVTSREEKSAHSHHQVLSSAVESSIARSTMIQECFNCKVTQTPLWRRSPDGNHLCNACGLYFKTHNSHRPIDWKATTIKRRRRRRQEFGVPAQYAQAAYQQQYSSAHYDDLHPSSPSSTGSQVDSHHQSISTPPESPSFYQSHDQLSRNRLPSLSTIFHPSSGSKSASLPRNLSSYDRSHYQKQVFAPYHQHKRSRSQEFEQAQYGRPAACYNPSSQTFGKVGKHHNLPSLSLPSHQARKMSPYHSPLSSSFPSRAQSPCDPPSPLTTDCVSRKSSTSALSDDTLPSLVSVLQGLVASVNNCKDKATKSRPSSPAESHINHNVLPGASTSNYSQVSPIISKKPSIHSLLN